MLCCKLVSGSGACQAGRSERIVPPLELRAAGLCFGAGGWATLWVVSGSLGPTCRKVTLVLAMPHRVVTVEEAMAVRVDTVVADTAMVAEATVAEATESPKYLARLQSRASSQLGRAWSCLAGLHPVFVSSPNKVLPLLQALMSGFLEGPLKPAPFGSRSLGRPVATCSRALLQTPSLRSAPLARTRTPAPRSVMAASLVRPSVFASLSVRL